MRPLYVYRPVLNADDIAQWALAMGFRSVVSPDEMHVTIARSRDPLRWPSPAQEPWTEHWESDRYVRPLGDDGAVALLFRSLYLHHSWERYLAAGASWEFDMYRPHFTITYNGAGVDCARLIPWLGSIELGGEVQQELEENPEIEEVA